MNCGNTSVNNSSIRTQSLQGSTRTKAGAAKIKPGYSTYWHVCGSGLGVGQAGPGHSTPGYESDVRIRMGGKMGWVGPQCQSVHIRAETGGLAGWARL